MNTNAEKQRDDLVGWWKFDEGSGESVFDATGHVPKGKIIGAKWWMAPNLIGINIRSSVTCIIFINRVHTAVNAGSRF